MHAQVHFPDHLEPHELDAYLERGWFRMGQGIFTTNFLHFHQQMYSALWLRVRLDETSHDSTQAKLFRQNKIFQVHIGPASLTLEQEELYVRYKQPLPFEPSASLHQLLFGKSIAQNIYHTYEVTVRDGDKLIAVGFFDVGATSGMGITSVYDPLYKKYSLGKFLIYLKMDFCRSRGFEFFYPGYFVPGYSFFDYKLTIGKRSLQFLELASQQWLPLGEFSPSKIPFQVMLDKLQLLRDRVGEGYADCKVLKYEYFDANLIPELKDFDLFDYPVMLQYTNPHANIMAPFVVYDVADEQYHMIVCSPAFTPKETTDNPDYYSKHLLMVEQEVFATASLKEMEDVVLKFMLP